MSMTRDLYLAILALDSYNRGYAPKVALEGDVIGSAAIRDDGLPLIGLWQDSSFYVVSYDTGGVGEIGFAITLSFRGTDAPRDALTGWIGGDGEDKVLYDLGENVNDLVITIAPDLDQELFDGFDKLTVQLRVEGTDTAGNTVEDLIFNVENVFLSDKADTVTVHKDQLVDIFRDAVEIDLGQASDGGREGDWLIFEPRVVSIFGEQGVFFRNGYAQVAVPGFDLLYDGYKAAGGIGPVLVAGTLVVEDFVFPNDKVKFVNVDSVRMTDLPDRFSLTSGADAGVHSGNGTIEGGGGNDVIYITNIPDGDLLVDGGEGSDFIIVSDGKAVKTAGGLGRDLIINFTPGGELIGDVVAGITDTGTEIVDVADSSDNADQFWYAGDTTILDPQKNDGYEFSPSIYGLGLLPSSGDLGMLLTFPSVFSLLRGGAGVASQVIKTTPLVMSMVQIWSAWSDVNAAMWLAGAAVRYSKALTWAAGADPLVIDLDGDGLALSRQPGQEWRLEEIGFNRYADIPVEVLGVRVTDGQVVDYTVEVTDRDGTFLVWARNLDRALGLQFETGDSREFQLRNFAVDLGTLDEVGSDDESTYSVELMTPGQFHFATSLGGIDFQPEMLSAARDNDTGLIDYKVSPGGSYTLSETQFDSVIDQMIELVEINFQLYYQMSRRIAMKMAIQGGLEDFARSIEYDALIAKYRPTTERELAPMFEAIFEGAPGRNDDDAVYDYLMEWNFLLNQIYPNYEPNDPGLFFESSQELDQPLIFQMLVTAHENAPVDLDLAAIMNAFGLDERRLVEHVVDDIEMRGPDGVNFYYLSEGYQTFIGSYEANAQLVSPDQAEVDIYVVGRNSGDDIIFDRDLGDQDQLRFAHLRSDEVRAVRDGDDVIDDLGNFSFGPLQTGMDFLMFRGDIPQETVRFTRDGASEDLLITILDEDGSETDQTVELVGQFGGARLNLGAFGEAIGADDGLDYVAPNLIEKIVFEKGATIEYQAIIEQVLANAKTDGDDVIYGIVNDNTLDGGVLLISDVEELL